LFGRDLKVRPAPARSLKNDAPGGRAVLPGLASWLDNFTGTAGAPWLWWAAALVVLLVLLLLGMKLLGLVPR
jgi:hypothetical protein